MVKDFFDIFTSNLNENLIIKYKRSELYGLNMEELFTNKAMEEDMTTNRFLCILFFRDRGFGFAEENDTFFVLW
jgi:hypothetical protein